MRLLRGALAALAVVVIGACGSSEKSTPSSGTEAVNQTFTGMLSDGSLVTLDFGTGTQAIQSTALHVKAGAATATGSIAVTGTVTRLDGTTVALTGTYDPDTKQFSISGGDYQFSGTYDGGAIQAMATVGGVPVKLVAMMGAPSAITQYCGTFTTALNETGVFSVVVSGGKAFGVAEGGVAFSGTVSGSAIAMRDDRGNPINATVSGAAVTGTFTNGDGQGTFSGSVETCTAILNPTATCTSFDYSQWGDCQPDGTQSRTVVSALPAGCKDGAPVLTQACVYVPSNTCAAPATNPAGIIYRTLSTDPLAPVAAGGSIVDGTYHRTSLTKFGQGSSGPDKDGGTSQAMVTIAGNDIDVVMTAGTTTERFRGTFEVSGTNLTITVTCSTAMDKPPGSTITVGYTATATALNVYETVDNTEEIFQLQGVQPPPLQCSVPLTNPAGPSQDKKSTAPSGPPAAGGTIPDGTYDLLMSITYAQSESTTTASANRRRLVISNGAIDVIASDDQAVTRFVGTVATNGTSVTVTVTCSNDPTQPVGTELVLGYTVDTVNMPGSTLLKLYPSWNNKEEVFKLLQ